MLGGVSVGEAVFQKTINEGVVAVFGAFPEGGKVVGNVGHGFGAAGDNAGSVACHDCLGGEDDGFGAGSADFVHSGADGGVPEASVEGALAGRILTKAREGGSKLEALFERDLKRSLLCR